MNVSFMNRDKFPDGAVLRLPAVRTPTWQDPVLEELRMLQELIPADQLDLHRRLGNLIRAVDYRAWQPDFPWPVGDEASQVLDMTPGGLWTNWVGAFLWLALRTGPDTVHGSAEALPVKRMIAHALTFIPVERWSTEDDTGWALAYQNYGRRFLEMHGATSNDGDATTQEPPP